MYTEEQIKESIIEDLKSKKTISSKKNYLTRSYKVANDHLNDQLHAYNNNRYLHGEKITSLQISLTKFERDYLKELRLSYEIQKTNKKNKRVILLTYTKNNRNFLFDIVKTSNLKSTKAYKNLNGILELDLSISRISFFYGDKQIKETLKSTFFTSDKINLLKQFNLI